MDIYGLLSQDHARVHSLFAALDEGQSDVDKARLFRELKHELDLHTQIEEELFYPELLHSPRTSDRVREALHEHGEIKNLLMRIDGMEVTDPEWGDGLQSVRRMVDDHVHDEESQIFPLARQVLSSRLQEDMFSRVKRRREELVAGAEGYEETVSYWRSKMRAGGREFAAQQARYAADQVHQIAEALRETADSARERGQDTVSGYLKGAANGLDYVSSSMYSGDVTALAHRATGFARQKPMLFVGGAFATGFMLSRFFKSSAARRGPTGEMH